jgi:hypothetical protein
MAFAVNAYSETPFSAEPTGTTVVVSGSQITSATGSITITGELGVNVFPTGQSLTVVNQIFTQDTLTAFGEAPFASESPSTFTAPNVIVTGNADIIPTGIALTTFIGNEDTDADADVSVTGSGLTTSAGDVFAGTVVEIDVTGIQSNIDLGTPIITPNTIAEVTGNSLSIVIGNEDTDADADVSVTGNSLSSAIGSVVTTANANVSISGIPLTTAVGTVDHNSTYTVSGEQLTTAIGQAEADDASAETTGVSATTSVGSPNIIAWSEVDTGTPVTWTTVDLAA